MQIRRSNKKKGVSLLELVVSMAVVLILIQVMNPLVKQTFGMLESAKERSLGMEAEKIIERLTWFSDSALGGRIVLINTTAGLSNRTINLEGIRAKDNIGNGIYIEVPSLCSKNGIWTLVSEGHLFRFMETANQGKHMRYIPVKNLYGGKEDIISLDISQGFFFKEENWVYINLKERRGKGIEQEIGRERY